MSDPASTPSKIEPTPEPGPGLYRKYMVSRLDSQDLPGGKHFGCKYFVLDLNHDPHAAAALRAYAQSCRADHPELAADLMRLATGYHNAQPAKAPRMGDGEWRDPDNDTEEHY